MAVPERRPALGTFEISNKTGFLPETPPLTSLPPYFRKWNEMVGQLSDLQTAPQSSA